ncbi:hypothetical protein [Loktanella sp. M215]|uniref:hypothetical protein n=1 Tax=Loktanella sp. M215 TaxID=2675431 RepID=UPI001F3B4C34|nr:hypothetical protein [Loktanella sp. M215]MCF7698165.1 hypothetical protein [Loktanella sp. M215]
MSDVSVKIVFHVGAHKTATTHLQHSIHGARRHVEAAGVRFFGPPALRQPGTRIEARFNLHFNPRKSVADLRPASEVLAEMLDGGTRLVLSEENFIGALFDRRYAGPFHSMPVPLYPDAADRLSALAACIAPDRGIDLCIGIRDPASFLNSAYGLVLQAGSGVAMENFKRRNPLAHIDWVDLVRRLRQAPGVASLTVWRHEDYHRLFDPVVAALLGAGVGPIRPVARVVNPGLSAAAVACALELKAAGADGPIVQQARDRFPVGPDTPAHDGFDAEERALSAEFYAVQVAEIAQMPGVTLLRPAPLG